MPFNNSSGFNSERPFLVNEPDMRQTVDFASDLYRVSSSREDFPPQNGSLKENQWKNHSSRGVSEQSKVTSEPVPSSRKFSLHSSAQLVQYLRSEKGVRSASVLAAMKLIPRDLFVPEASVSEAFFDTQIKSRWGTTLW